MDPMQKFIVDRPSTVWTIICAHILRKQTLWEGANRRSKLHYLKWLLKASMQTMEEDIRPQDGG